jgi:hypothetical protein
MRPKQSKSKLAFIISKYIGQPFEQIGCMPLVAGIYTDLGMAFPREHEDLTLEKDMETFQKDPAGTVARMEELFSGLGEPANPDCLKVRDLLVVAHPDGVRFPAVYIGGDAAIASFLKGGVTVFGLNSHNKVVMARRLASEKAASRRHS